MSDLNFSKYIPNAVNLKLPTFNTTTKSSFFSSNVSRITPTIAVPNGSPIFRVISYLLAIFIVVMIILLFAHYFITPVFKLKPGGSGIIPIPGGDDGVLYWNKGSSGVIHDKQTPLYGQYYGYTMNLDVFIENPLQFSQHPRVLFSRGGLLKETPTSETLMGLYEYYNMVIALLPDTNDIIVSTLNKHKNMENIIIPNVPVQESFRISVVLMENAMEVYMNGKLIKTRALLSAPLDVKGDIYGPISINTSIVKVRNLKLWNRILTTNEIKYATPSISSTKDFNPTNMPSSSSSSSSCPSLTSATERLEKLSL